MASTTRKEGSSGAATAVEVSTGQKKYLGQTKAAWYIYWICAVASIANIFQGFDSGIYSIIISNDYYIKYFDVHGSREGAISSMVNLGNVLGNLFVSWWFIWFLGRKQAFALGTIVLLIGVALQAGAINFPMIIIGRIISGIGTAIVGTNLAAYQAEVSSPLIRGRVVSFVQLSYQVGVLIAYCVGLGTDRIKSNLNWRFATALQVIPGVILIIAAQLIPESPRWILERHPDHPERALRQLSRIRLLPEEDPAVQEEYLELLASHEYRKEHQEQLSYRSFLSTYPMWKRIAYGMATMAIGQLSGVGGLTLYGVLIFEGLGFSSGTESLLLNVVSGCLCLAACLITTGGVDKWGRRITLILGTGIIVVSYIIIASLADAYPTKTNFNRGASIVQVVFIYVIEMAYAGALGPTAWIYASEIFPTQYRDKGVNLSQAGQQLSTLWINQAWPSLFDTLSHNGYWVLMGINVISFTVVILFWPETRGIGLERMDKIFGEVDKVGMWKDEHAGQHVEGTGLTVRGESVAEGMANGAEGEKRAVGVSEHNEGQKV